MCPHGFMLESEKCHKVGMCKEYYAFILGFDDGSSNVNAILERLNLYVAEMQCMDDYQQFLKECRSLDVMKKKDNTPDTIERQQWKVNSHRMWWERLNKQVLDSYSKMLARQQPKKLEVNTNKNISLGELHSLVANAKKVVDAEIVEETNEKSN